MKTRISLLHLIAPFFTLFILPYVNAQAPLPQDVFEKVSPAMMILKTYDSDSTLYASGSAVAIGDSGIVFTNMHIFKDAKWMELVSGSVNIRDIKIVGFEPDRDILILKIPAGIIPGIKAANSDSVRVGEPVYAIGNPLGFTNTFSNGILSGVRYIDDKQIQFTASISPGSSGGALVNSKGELIGITALTYNRGQNLNFAVPVNYYTNTEIIDAADTERVNLFRDIVEIYNSESSLSADEVENRLSRFSPDSTGNRAALYTEAKIYHDKKMESSALKVCCSALERFPTDKQFYLLRGEEYLSVDSSDKALVDFNNALEIDSAYQSALVDRACFYRYFRNDNISALKDMFRLVSISEANEFLYLDIAEIYQNMHDTVNAISSLRKSYGYEGFTAQMLYERGRVFSDLQQYDEAVSDFTSAISQNTENSEYYFSRAIAYSKNGNHNNALADYFSVLRFDSRNVSALSNMAYEYFNLKDYNKAEENFLKAISITDKDFDSYIGLAITARKLNRIKECLQNMYRAMKLKPALENGMAGLDTLKKDGYFWSNEEMKNIRGVFILMGIEDSGLYAGFDNDEADESAPNPQPLKMARSVK